MLSVAVHAHFLLFPPTVVASQNDGLIYIFLNHYVSKWEPILIILLYHFLVISQALRLNYVFNNHRMFTRSSYLTAMVYVLVTAVFTQWNQLTPALVANTLDDTDALIGYQMVNTGDQIHFLFNQQEKRTQLLSSQSIAPSGQLIRNPTLKNLDKGYDFMPRYGKQIGMRQIIVPCMYRNYLCFARVEL